MLFTKPTGSDFQKFVKLHFKCLQTVTRYWPELNESCTVQIIKYNLIKTFYRNNGKFHLMTNNLTYIMF